MDHPHRHQDPARRLRRRGDRLGVGGVHPEREPQRPHHDAALAETLALREGQVPGEQEGPLEDEEDAGTTTPLKDDTYMTSALRGGGAGTLKSRQINKP